MTIRCTAVAWPLLAVAVFAAAAARAERQPYSRYQSIVDRQMFGPLPANFDPTKSPAEVSGRSGSAAEKELTKEQEKMKSAIRFTVINVTPEGDTAIGFSDNSDQKSPKHYYLKVGETKDGWVVKEADAKAATMTVEKDGVEVSLTLGGDSSKGGSSGGRDDAVAQPRRSTLLNTLGGRRRMRREMEEEEARESAKRAAERAAEEKAREEERARREEEEKAQRAAEREESRRQLLQIQEELRKQREERQKQESEQKPASDEESSDNNQ